MGEERDDGSIKCYPTVTGYVSALKHFYKENKVEMEKETKIYLEDFQHGNIYTYLFQ